MLISWITKLLVVFNTNTRPVHVAAGIAWGITLGLLPSDNLLWICLFLITFFLKINTTIQVLFLGLGKMLLPLMEGALNKLGAAVLTSPGLQGLFTGLYNLPLFPFTRFNNTLVTGGLLAGVCCWLPVFFLSLLLLKLYREHVRETIANLKFVKMIAKSPFVMKVWRGYRQLKGTGDELGAM